jgi:hypothetical protein
MFLRILIFLSEMSNLVPFLFSFLLILGPIAEGQTALHRANLINNSLGDSSSRLTGKNVKIMVRDEGFIGPHIDFKGRLTNLIKNRDGGPDHHEDLVAGCFAGASNLNPTIEGLAPGAKIFAIPYSSRFSRLDTTLGLHQRHNVVISNTSYGDFFAPCNGGYNQNAKTVDLQIFENPTLMHVFSAGNGGGMDCGFGIWFGNLAGGHLTAKNAIAVGAVTQFSILSGFSSRGPTSDKRLKPDILAMGQDYATTFPPHRFQTTNGTSLASPAVAGIMAQLYQAHKEMNNGTNPPSALIKAVMCNTAEDLGNPGPDYSHGFGLVHAGRAYESLRDRQYIADSLPQLGNQSHTLEIPAGISEARIMLYWPDKEATPGAQKALVNDLDITLTDTSGTIYQPLVLDPTPILSRLRADAVPGTDTLNNIEQIVLKNPIAGSYQVHVNGSRMPTGKIGYYLTYYFFKDTLQLTFPLGGEAFRPQEDLILRWDAYSDTGSFDIDYTLDDGRTWTPIATGVNGTLRYQTWQTPAQISGQARVRITRGPQVSESRANFTIIETPKNIQFARVCQDFVSLTWDAVPGAKSYDVFVLGEKYMDSVGTTTNTFFQPRIRYQNENWFSVRARGDSGILGRRAIAVKQDAGTLVNCAGVPTTAAFVIDTIQCDSQWVFLQDQSLKSPDHWQWIVSPDTGVGFIQQSTDSSRHPIISFSDTGSYQVTLKTINQFGIDSTTQTVHIQSCNTANTSDFEPFSLRIVPNPNEGVFQLRMAGELKGQYRVELMDLQGKRLWEKTFQVQGNQLVEDVDVQELGAGVYLLRVGDGNEAVVRKVVVR